ncbi:MAG: hypothetical protein QOI74_1302 [Micromonosporaceae bacterium]|nr:hypothetical protein [Micromonosporaceae bacterium]MDT5035809.1 hypothetical protein [Micromonosporaceae bacterium]
MQYDQLITQIQNETGLTSRDDADEALRATLEALGTGIPEDLADELAAQLPDEIARYLQPPAMVAAGGSAMINRREFVHRIAEACHVNDDQAAQIIPAMFAAIDRATGGMITTEVRDALPAEMRSLTGPGTTPYGMTGTFPDEY